MRIFYTQCTVLGVMKHVEMNKICSCSQGSHSLLEDGSVVRVLQECEKLYSRGITEINEQQ